MSSNEKDNVLRVAESSTVRNNDRKSNVAIPIRPRACERELTILMRKTFESTFYTVPRGKQSAIKNYQVSNRSRQQNPLQHARVCDDERACNTFVGCRTNIDKVLVPTSR